MSTMFSSKSSGGGAVVPPRRGGMLRVLAGVICRVWSAGVSGDLRASGALRASGVDAGQVELGGAADDEVAAGCHFGAHQQAEHVAGGLGVLDLDAPQDAVPRVHGGLGELPGV